MSVCASCGHSAADPFQFCPKCGTRHLGGAEGGLIGRTLMGKYRIIEEVGVGSMGTVYRAEHTGLRRKVAIKVLHRELQVDNEALQRFQREGIAAGHLQHPNAIQMFDFDRSEDGQYFLAMEFVEGESLRARLQGDGMPAAEAIELTRQLLSVLAEAHRAGIVHRDLKPENLMLVATTDGPQLKVLDFGLSKLVQRPVDASLLTHAGRVLGTPLYMAPEQWRGEEADHRTDLHAVGVLLFEMLAGQTPFQGRDLAEAMLRSTSYDAPALVEVAPTRRFPRGLDEIVHTALAKSRADRWQTADELMAALEAVDLHTSSPPTGGRRRARRPTPTKRTNVRPLAIGIGIAVMVLAAAGFWLWGGGAAAAPGKLVRTIALSARSPEQRNYVDLLDAVGDELRRGNVTSALAVAQKAAGQACVDAEGFLLRGRAFAARGDLDLARADLSEAETRAPTWAAPATALGWIALAQGDHAGADVAFQRALAAEPAAPEPAAGIAAGLLAVADAAAAKASLLPLSEQYPDCAPAHLHLGRACLHLEDFDRAVASFVMARRRDPGLWQASEGLGDTYAKKGDVAAATQQYRDAKEIAPTASELRQTLVLALLEARRASEAEAALPVTGADARPLWPIVRALAACERSDFTTAETALSEAGKLEGTPPLAMALLGLLRGQRGDHAGAAAACEQAVLAEDAIAEGHLGWGIALFRRGEFGLAATRLERALALAGPDPFLHYTLGLLYRDWLLRPGDALRHFERYRGVRGEDPRVATWIDALVAEGAKPTEAPDAATPAVAHDDPIGSALRRAVTAAAVRLRARQDVFEDHSTAEKAWEVTSRHFLVRTTHSHGLAANLAEGLDTMLAHFQETLGVNIPPTRRYHVYVLPTVGDYNQFGNANGQEHSSCYGSFHAAEHAERPVAAVYDPNHTWLRMMVTHSMVHQYVQDAFPAARLPTWVDEGLAAYFATWWDYNWALAEYERLEAADRLVPLARLTREPLGAYVAGAHERFTSLGIVFTWLLRYREDTATRGDSAPFRDWVVALLRGDSKAASLAPAALADPAKLQQELAAFEFPR